jgi:hypothetical protein
LEEDARNAATMAWSVANDPLPKPEQVTFGHFDRIVREQQELWPHIANPLARQAWHRREILLWSVPGYNELRKLLQTRMDLELGSYLTPEAIQQVRRLLAFQFKQGFDAIDRSRVTEVVAALNSIKPPAIAGDTDSKKPPSPEGKSKPLDGPASRVVAAAYTLQKAGKPVSVRAACKAAGVDRNNLAANHPEIVKLIEQLAEPDRKPRSGLRDRRTGNLDGCDDPEDDLGDD